MYCNVHHTIHPNNMWHLFQLRGHNPVDLHTGHTVTSPITAALLRHRMSTFSFTNGTLRCGTWKSRRRHLRRRAALCVPHTAWVFGSAVGSGWTPSTTLPVRLIGNVYFFPAIVAPVGGNPGDEMWRGQSPVFHGCRET